MPKVDLAFIYYFNKDLSKNNLKCLFNFLGHENQSKMINNSSFRLPMLNLVKTMQKKHCCPKIMKSE